MRSFDVAYRFRLLPTLSNIPSIRAHAVAVVVVVVVVDVAGRRDAKKNTTHSLKHHCRSLFLHAIDMYFTSLTILDQYSADLSVSSSMSIDNSM